MATAKPFGPMPDGPVRVLLVDDDREDYLITRDLLADLPGGRFHLEWAGTYEAGLEALCSGQYDVVLLDYRLGARTGVELLLEARGRQCLGPYIVLTGKGEYAIDEAAMRAGAADYLEKGQLDPSRLERSIRYALQQRRYEADLERNVRERTAELAKVNATLREADRRKDEFLATLAHELRNPLAPIRNSLEIMRLSGDDPAAVGRARGMLERQVGQMVRLINDLLDVSRITRGKLQLTYEPVELSEVVEAALEISAPALEKADLELTVDVPDDPIRLVADRVRLAQVFSNILNNAAKYTESGGSVTLSAAQSGSQVFVSVRDTGVGIPAEMLPQVFELFTQVNRSLNRAEGGLGIGLALVKRLAELHGGSVEVKSDGPGRGSEFTVRLPTAGSGWQPPEPAAA
jgi:signal transduction histidine kinase